MKRHRIAPKNTVRQDNQAAAIAGISEGIVEYPPASPLYISNGYSPYDDYAGESTRLIFDFPGQSERVRVHSAYLQPELPCLSHFGLRLSAKSRTDSLVSEVNEGTKAGTARKSTGIPSMPLTDLQLRRARPEPKAYKITDGSGLFIEIRPTGSKLWRYRYRIAGKENTFALGEYPELTLAAAREARDEARKLTRQGIHPAHARHADKLNNIAEGAQTFEAIAREFAEQKAKVWSDRYCGQFDRAMSNNVYPMIGKLPIRQVTSMHILEILRRMDKRGAATYAFSIRQWCSAVFRYAASTMRADGDPAAALKGAISRPAVKHARALEQSEISEYLGKLRRFGGNRTTGICLELLMLTFVRSAEIRQARWEDFDLEGAVWRIPAERMKMKRIHVVPLARRSVELLRELQAITGGGEWLFPNTRRPRDVMSPTTINRALEYMGYESGRVTGHDFRATASTRLNEMGYPEAHIEMQLAHAKRNKTAAAYNHAQYLAERTRMMQDWADYVYSLGNEGKVVPIRAKGVAL